jgi:hypothetical protein
VGDHLIGWFESGQYCVDFTTSVRPKPLSMQLARLYPRPVCVPPCEYWARPTILNTPFGHLDWVHGNPERRQPKWLRR